MKHFESYDALHSWMAERIADLFLRAVLFTGIISDLFPGVKLPDPDYGSLMEMMQRITLEMGLQTVPVFMQKAIQLYDVTVLRHGLMTVGPTGGGKTCCKNMLAKTLSTLKKERDEYIEVRQFNMNPKSITMGQLYGSFDDATHEWSDGILCKLFREAVYDTVERQKWVRASYSLSDSPSTRVVSFPVPFFVLPLSAPPLCCERTRVC